MKLGSVRIATVVAALAVAGMATAMIPTASAQPGWGGGMGGMGGMGPGLMGPGMMGPGGMWGGGMCQPRAAGLAEWRADRVERLVQPNEAQRAKLDELRKASARAAEIIRAACPTDLPQSPVARLELMEKRSSAMLEALKLVRPAFTEFYNALDDSQKARLNNVGPRRWGWQQWRQPKQ
ncbi:MAG: Spy/CpxP family protein refolding chaperone [Hyphomicrobiales bacterium]|nr:Spy/CpxP family protein refolding chaperone [Hyphomicrobiales bacterium]